MLIFRGVAQNYHTFHQNGSHSMIPTIASCITLISQASQKIGAIYAAKKEMIHLNQPLNLQSSQPTIEFSRGFTRYFLNEIPQNKLPNENKNKTPFS